MRGSSSDASGSSINRSFGWDRSARPMATLWRSPRTGLPGCAAKAPEAPEGQRSAPSPRASGDGCAGIGQVLGHRHMREKPSILKHITNPPPVRRQVVERLAIQQDFGPIRPQSPATTLTMLVLPDPDRPKRQVRPPAGAYPRPAGSRETHAIDECPASSPRDPSGHPPRQPFRQPKRQERHHDRDQDQPQGRGIAARHLQERVDAVGSVWVWPGMLATKVIVAPNSPIALAKASTAPAMIPGKISGRVTVRTPRGARRPTSRLHPQASGPRPRWPALSP